jgi:antirestriction protein ArdC
MNRMPLSRDVATEEVELFRSGNFVDSASAAYPASLLFFEFSRSFGSAAYAMEELRAELASAFGATDLGIRPDSRRLSSYIANWIKPLKEDKREIFRAAADA